MLRRVWATALLLSLSAAAARIQVEQGQLQLLNSLGSTAHSSSFDVDKGVSETFEVDTGDSLKLSFVTIDKNGSPFVPKQVEVLWRPEDPTEASEPGRWFKSKPRVRKGKAKLDIDFVRAPPKLLALSKGRVKATVLIGSDGYDGLVQIPIGSYTFSDALSLEWPWPRDQDLPAHWQAHLFKPQPEKTWSNKGPEKQISKIIALFGIAFVLSPWLVASFISTKLQVPLTAQPSFNTIAFIACIVAFELLYVTYWVGLKLIPTLPVFFGLAVLTAFVGRRALADVRVRRLAADKKVD